MRSLFFYGLFMDAEALRDKGFHPTVIGPASLPGYRILIGDRASLEPCPHSTAYGVVMDLPNGEADALYAAPDVRDYVAEEVCVQLEGGISPTSALCYTLPQDLLEHKANGRYAEKLSSLALRLGFPKDYAEEILRQRAE